MVMFHNAVLTFVVLLALSTFLISLSGCGPGPGSWEQTTIEEVEKIRQGNWTRLTLPHPVVLEQISKEPQLSKMVLEIEFGNDLSRYNDETLSSFSNLGSVIIYGGSGTDRILKVLSNCESLKKVIIQECDVSDDGIYALSKCLGLELIEIESEIVKLSKDAIMSLRDLDHLRILKVSNKGNVFTIQDLAR
jgi:hypothetical protein